MRLLLFAILVFSSLAYSQSAFTAGMSYGRLWLSLDSDARIAYLTAIKDILIATKPQDEAEYLPGRYTVAEIAKGVDQFYDSPENTFIPVVFGLRVCVMKFDGASQAVIDAVLSGMRKQLAEAAQPHK
jgi:hypothetical protein